jgi:ribonuclease P protein component
MTSRYFAAFCLRPEAALPAAPSRFGFTVPRAVGKAVERNRIKRRMREAVRANWQILPDGWTVVFNPRRNAMELPFEDLCREVARIFSRCK